MINKPTIVVARYNENIDWILDNDLQDRCIVYNKSSIKGIYSKKHGNITDKLKIINISNIPVFGREGDTYLKHIISNYENIADYTIFTQADPFDHSPQFIEIIKHLDTIGYKDYQPLSCYWLKDMNIPPSELVNNETSDYIDTFPIRMESCDGNMFPYQYYDNGIFWMASQYRNKHRVPYNLSIADHFGKHIDKKISVPIKFAFGAIFGVSKELILKHEQDFYNKLLSYLRIHPTHGYVLERMWHSIFKEV